MFGVAQDALNPFITSGTNILPTLQNEATGGAGTFGKTLQDLLTPGQSASVLATMPGFQFASQYGTMAATNALAARGLGGSAGPVARGIADYNNGLAGTQYFNTVSALQNAYTGRVGALQNFAGIGGNAAGSLAGNAISSGNSIAGTYGTIGNASAAGTLGVSNALSGGLTGGSNALALPMLLNQLKGGGGSASGGIYGPQNTPDNYSGMGSWA